MKQRHKKGNQQPVWRGLAQLPPKKNWFKRQWPFVLCALVGMGVLVTVIWNKSHPTTLTFGGGERAQGYTTKSPQTLSELLGLPTSELGRCDTAMLNLLCAQGLPGAEQINISDYLATLDQWARHVRSETERNFHKFRDNPADFYYSEGYSRMLIIAVVMYEDFGIRYNPDRIAISGNLDPNDRFFADSRDIFLHGLVGNRRMGTCSSMPVLYAAIGRRLGYPLKLATTKAHLFLRWEDDKERFDLEATGKGMNRYDDEHFKQWPFLVSDEEIRTEGYLKSLTATEELAVFLSLRGDCLKEAGRMTEAADCFAAALHLSPGWNAYRALLADAQSTVGASTALPLQHPQALGGILEPNHNNRARQPDAAPDPNPLLIIR